MATRRRYTARQKAEAVGIAAVEGVTRAGELTGIAKQTIDYWTHDPAFGQLRTTAREVVVEQFWVGIQIGARAVLEGFSSDAPLRDKAQALGTLVEKYALLSGEATSRTEHLDVDVIESDTLIRFDAALISAAERPTVVRNGNGNGATGHDALSALPLPARDPGGPKH